MHTIRAWRQQFEAHQRRPDPDVGRALDALPEAWIAPLTASFERFQASETSEGRVVNEVRTSTWAPIDDDYREAIRLFVAEEGRHARVLGLARRALGGEVRVAKARAEGSDWANTGFRLGRRAIGLSGKLIVLWSAEIAAIEVYRAIGERLPDCGIRDALRQIMADEERHLGFHTAFFAGACRDPLSRMAATAALYAAASAALAVLLVDHRALWPLLGVSPAEIARRARARMAETAAALAVPVGPALEPA